MKHFISYAQNYEDVMLNRIFKDVQHGFYIDVGAQDPEIDSVTRAFYERGWRGINIEPVQHWFGRLQEQRPYDINLKVAVSDHPGELKLYESDASGLSTSDDAFAADARARGWAMREIQVPCMTLEQICAEQDVRTVHFLKVDCEGGEAQALRGMPFRKIRPWVVVVEATEPNSTRPTHQQWEPLLTDNQYQFVYFDGINRYYVAQEHADLRGAFAVPPNVFDWFRRAEEVRLEAERDYWFRENERREVALGESRTLIDAMRDASTNLQAEILRLQHERDTLQARLQSDVAEIAQLQGEVRGKGEEISRLQHEWRENAHERDQMRASLEQMRASRSWKVTAPLRGASHAARATLRRCKGGIKVVLRRPARAMRPTLKRIAFNPRAHSVAMFLLGGRDSALSRRLRIFLFGAPPMEQRSIARIGEELDPSLYSRRERAALSALQDALPTRPESEE